MYNYSFEGDNVKCESIDRNEVVYFARAKTETSRINANTVVDTIYEFDIELGQYVLLSSTERDAQEPLSELAQLRAENAQLRNDLDDLILMMADLIIG